MESGLAGVEDEVWVLPLGWRRLGRWVRVPVAAYGVASRATTATRNRETTNVRSSNQRYLKNVTMVDAKWSAGPRRVRLSGATKANVFDFFLGSDYRLIALDKLSCRASTLYT